MSPLWYFVLSSVTVVVTGLLCYRQGVKDFTAANRDFLVGAATVIEAALSRPVGEPLHVTMTHEVDDEGVAFVRITGADGAPLVGEER